MESYAIDQHISFYIGENVHAGTIVSVQAHEVFVIVDGHGSLIRVPFSSIVSEENARINVFDEAVRKAGALLW